MLFSHKHIVYLETIELVIGTLGKRRVDASQICNKFLQFHIAYTKVDKIQSLTEHNKLLDMLEELTTKESDSRKWGWVHETAGFAIFSVVMQKESKR